MVWPLGASPALTRATSVAGRATGVASRAAAAVGRDPARARRAGGPSGIAHVYYRVHPRVLRQPSQAVHGRHGGRLAGNMASSAAGLAPLLAAASALRQLPLHMRLMDFLVPSLILLLFTTLQGTMRGAWYRSRSLGGAALVVCAAPVFYSTTRRNLPPFSVEDVKSLFAQLARVCRPTDAVYVYYGAGQALRWYGHPMKPARAATAPRSSAVITTELSVSDKPINYYLTTDYKKITTFLLMHGYFKRPPVSATSRARPRRAAGAAATQFAPPGFRAGRRR